MRKKMRTRKKYMTKKQELQWYVSGITQYCEVVIRDLKNKKYEDVDYNIDSASFLSGKLVALYQAREKKKKDEK